MGRRGTDATIHESGNLPGADSASNPFAQEGAEPMRHWPWFTVLGMLATVLGYQAFLLPPFPGLLSRLRSPTLEPHPEKRRFFSNNELRLRKPS